MKKIFAFVGSQAGENSKTFCLIKRIINKVNENVNGELKYDIITPDNMKINKCKSCNNCFNTGICNLDEKDDMKIIKKKMIEADLIIFASPVYAHNVSGDMKIFIDRISYWMHIMKLAGKAGVILSSSASNGNKLVNDYLYKIMSILGIKVIGNFSATSICVDNDLEDELDKFSKVILQYINSKMEIISDKFLDSIFITQREIMKLQKNVNANEYLYWLENGYFECENFNELLNRL